MKKLLLFTCCLLVSAVMLAQPTLDYPQNAPQIGEVSQIQFVTPGDITFATSGPDVTWDYSELTPIYGGEITAIDPSQAPAGAQFPASNVAISMGDTIFTFTLANADGYHYLGSQSTTGSYPSILVYSDSRTFLKFPFTYEDTYFDAYKGVVTTAAATVHVTAFSELYADAYGTLILPSGTYTNVLRTVTVDAELDSVFVGGSFMKSFDILRTQFSWFEEDGPGPLMSIEIMSNEGLGSLDTMAYYITSGSGIGDDQQSQISQLRVYPNPADQHVTIAFKTSPNTGATISIVNQVGQVVISRTVNAKSMGSVNENIDISTLPPGIYFANINCDCSKQLTEKFVIR